MPPRRFPTAAAPRPRLTPLVFALHSAAAAAMLAAGPAARAEAAFGQTAQLGQYDVPAGPLADALNRFAQQSGTSIVADAARLQGLRSEGLKGAFGVEEGFNTLLRGSGYAIGRTASGYVLVPAPQTGPRSDGALVLPTVTVSGAGRGERPSEGTGDYRVRSSRGATGLPLTLRETPQSVSVVTRTQMDDFKLTSVNDVLGATPGVVVEKVETDRTYYTARGFNITSFQEDGIGVPFAHGLVGGDLESFVYDRVEVVRGANGLLSNTGNPSATVNLIRKRPTAEPQATVGAGYGSWNDKRLEADVSGPLTASGALRGRLVAVGEDANSYLDRHGRTRTTFYGVIEADLDEDTTVTLGHTRQMNRTDGQLWGGLPLYYSDGGRTDYDRSVTTAANWSHLNTTTRDSFVEVAHRFGEDWEAKAVYTRKTIAWDGKLFYVYGLPDRATGLGLFGMPGDYNTENRQHRLDVQASGGFTLGGRRHQLVLGANLSVSRVDGQTWNAADVPLPALEGWDGGTPDPVYNIDGGRADFKDTQRSVYAATRLSLTDALTLIVGANATHAEASGTNFGTPRTRTDSEITPYAGAVYDITDSLSAYAGYTKIFNPQSEVDAGLQQLDPVMGSSVEAGLKAELFGGRAIGSVAVFRSEQTNLASYAGMVGTTAVYEGTDVTSRGVEFELAGQVTDRLQATAGYSRLWLEDEDGNDTRLYTPRHILRLTTTYRVPGLDALKVGANLNWRSKTSNQASSLPLTIAQKSYAILNLMGRYDLTDRVHLNLTLNNLTDEKYLTSRYWGDQGFYGAPRSAFLSVNWTY